MSRGPLWPRAPECPKSVPRVSPECPDTFLTPRGHSRDTFWTLRSPGPEGTSRHSVDTPSDTPHFKLGRTPKGAYSSRGRSRHLLETPFSEPLLRTLLRTPFYCKTHSRPPSQNPSENPFPRTFSKPFLERCVAVRPLRRCTQTLSGTPCRTLSGTLRARRARKTPVPGRRVPNSIEHSRGHPKGNRTQKFMFLCIFLPEFLGSANSQSIAVKEFWFSHVEFEVLMCGGICVKFLVANFPGN